MTHAMIHAPGNAISTSDSRRFPDERLYAFESRFFPTDEGALHYVDEGAGRPVFFVHGTPSWSFEWRHAIRALRGRYRVLAPDHLGFGLSDKPARAGYRPEDHAARLLAFVRALDLRDLTLVVHDFGGPIGLPVLLEEPDRVRSLVVVNSWMWPHAGDPRVRLLSRFVASPLGKLLYLGFNASPRWLLPASFADRRVLEPAVHRHYLAPFARREERRAPWVLGCELAGSDSYYAALWARRATLHRVPTTLVWGMKDAAFGPGYLARWTAELPAATVVPLAGVGHFPQEEAPAAFVAALGGALSP